MRTFKMNDLHNLVEIIGSSSASDDRLPAFLAKFDFVDKYETDDDSIVFVTGNNEQLEIEFFDIDSCTFHGFFLSTCRGGGYLQTVRRTGCWLQLR